MRCLKGLMLAGFLIACVNDAAASPRLLVNIAPQPLSSAIDKFAAQTGIVIIAPSEILKHKKTRGFTKEGTISTLLQYLLAGTGLHYEQHSANVYGLTASPSPAIAYKKRTVSEQKDEYQEILVSGRYVDSLASAWNRKRQADTIIDGIAAQDVNRFPAQNIAEALQRVTGITVSRDRGEALFVSVRGLDSSFQAVTLNGRPLAVNENVRDSGQFGRQFRFDTIPADLVAGVDVIKTPDAAQDEGAIGGTINIRTFKPFDLPDKTVTASATASYPELADKIDPGLSMLGSWHSDNQSLGVLAAISYNERSLRQDRIKLAGWSDYSPADGPFSGEALIVPHSFRPTLEREERQRLGLNGIIQYRPSDILELTLRSFYVHLESDYDELSYSADLDLEALSDSSFEVTDGAVTALSGSGSSQIGLETSRLIHENLFTGLQAAWDWQTFRLTSDVNFTRAVSNTDKPITRTRLSGDVGRIAFDVPYISEGLPDIYFLDTDISQPGTIPLRRIEIRAQESEDTELAAQLDFASDMNWAGFFSLEAGYKYRNRTRRYDRQDRLYQQNAGEFFPASFYSPFEESGFLGGISGDLPRSWYRPNADAFAIAENVDNSFGAPTPSDLRNSYRIEEEIHSFYIATRFKDQIWGATLRGNLGVRLSHTEQKSSGYALKGPEAIPVSSGLDYLDILPSANLIVENSGGWIWRASVARVIARPSLADLAPRITLHSSGELNTAIGGNPMLNRYQAWQFDIAASYSSSKDEALSMGLFYKKFDSFVFDQTSDVLIDGEIYSLTAPTNGGDAYIYGAELAIQKQFSGLPSPWDGLGLQANLTLTRGRASYSETVKDDLENVAPISFSFGPFFEYGPLQARLIYNYRGEIMNAVGTNNRLETNEDSVGILDGAVSLRINQHIEIALEAQNILKETQRLFVQDNHFAGYTSFGRTIMLSLRFNSQRFSRDRQDLW